MPTRSEAEEHLRVIRSLMEKATIYRAISAPTALLGGVLSNRRSNFIGALGGIGSSLLIPPITKSTFFLALDCGARGVTASGKLLVLVSRLKTPG